MSKRSLAYKKIGIKEALKDSSFRASRCLRPRGLEPLTSRTSSGRSSQLSYDRIYCHICFLVTFYILQEQAESRKRFL